MVVNLEFELTKVIQKQAGKCNNKNNKLVFYTAVLFQYGSILMPLSMREKLQHFMTFGSHNVHFIKKNPQRISYDTVEFLLMNISVEKPGKVHNVLMKMCKQVRYGKSLFRKPPKGWPLYQNYVLYSSFNLQFNSSFKLLIFKNDRLTKVIFIFFGGFYPPPQKVSKIFIFLVTRPFLEKCFCSGKCWKYLVKIQNL